MMRALGELILADTSKHSFIDSVKEYLGDRMEFVAGWMYWACWLTLAMADLTATGISTSLGNLLEILVPVNASVGWSAVNRCSFDVG